MFKRIYEAVRKNPQEGKKRKRKAIKGFYRKTKDGKVVYVSPFTREYPEADKLDNKKRREKGVDENNNGRLVKNKEEAKKQLACSLK